MSASFEVRGIKELINALQQLDKNVARKVARQSIRAGLKPVLSVARANAPVGETGKLRKNVKIRAGKKSRSAIMLNIGVGNKDWTGESWYGPATEFGSSRQKPQGWMRRTFDETGEQAKDTMMSEMAAGIEREIKAVAV